MIELIKDIIEQDYPIILTSGLFFLVGIGIGSAVSEALYREKGAKNETQMDKRRTGVPEVGLNEQRDK